MERENKLLGYYNYTVILTYIGLLCGFMGVLFAFDRNIHHALICLMLAGFCDMFDGAVASTRQRTDREKCFGIQIDSLSDLVCFGVLPAVVVYSLDARSLLGQTAACLYVLCALIRLAYFNVDEQERQKENSGGREIYYGLPVTLSALFVPVTCVLGSSLHWKVSRVLAVLLICMAALFLAPFRLKKPHLLGKLAVLLCGVAEVIFVIFAGADV